MASTVNTLKTPQGYHKILAGSSGGRPGPTRVLWSEYERKGWHLTRRGRIRRGKSPKRKPHVSSKSKMTTNVQTKSKALGGAQQWGSSEGRRQWSSCLWRRNKAHWNLVGPVQNKSHELEQLYHLIRVTSLIWDQSLPDGQRHYKYFKSANGPLQSDTQHACAHKHTHMHYETPTFRLTAKHEKQASLK